MMKTLESPRPDRVIIFTRYPTPGKTKKRLIPALGPIGAAELHREMTEKILNVVRKAASGKTMDVEVCFDGGTEHRMGCWLGPGLTFSAQVEGDLGERLGAAFDQAFRKGAKRVVLIGADIPDACERHIDQAFDALGDHDLVFGPSIDGGYWLLGMKGPADLFHGIPWGTGKVLEKSIAVAREKGLSIHRLETLTDLDRKEDLARLMPEWTERGPYISAIIPTLNEANHVQGAVEGARSDGVEVIVVDGGSTDNTVALAEKAGARVYSTQPGRAVQQNRGAKLALGSVLLFLHADTVLPGDYEVQVFETLMDRRIVLGAFRFKTDLDHPMMKGIEALTNFRSRFLGLPYGDQGLFLRKEVFRQVNGFPRVPIAEDLFFVRKLSRLGRIGIAPGHVVTSARRWRKVGLLRTTLLNQIIVAGCYLGVPTRKLVPLYKKRPGKSD